MTKYKNGMATRGITYLTTDTLPLTVMKMSFSLLPLGGYPWPDLVYSW